MLLVKGMCLLKLVSVEISAPHLQLKCMGGHFFHAIQYYHTLWWWYMHCKKQTMMSFNNEIGSWMGMCSPRPALGYATAYVSSGKPSNFESLSCLGLQTLDNITWNLYLWQVCIIHIIIYIDFWNMLEYIVHSVNI